MKTFAMESVMGQVIPWPGPERQSARPATDTDGPKGRVLLFLGVRYERHDDENSSPSAGQTRISPNERPSRRRKRG
jgi:hypothetical protein